MSMMTANAGTGRWIGLGMVAALHVGMFAAISSGLNIHVFKETPPPFKWVDLPPETHVKPEPFKPEFDTPRMSDPELPPLPPLDLTVTRETLLDPPDTRTAGREETAGAGQGVVPEEPVTQSSVDPRHPLTEPEYPPRARLLNEQGKVRLKIHVMANGRIDSVIVVNSSGYQRLDDAAIQHALKHWSMVPASKGGNAVDSWVEIPVVFRLN
jgi:protein TonB